jgi:hypothetical protein
MPPFGTSDGGQQQALYALKRLSEASLELFDSEPALSNTVAAWLKQRLDHEGDGSRREQAGVAALISDQQVVQQLSAAVTTLLKGLAAATADAYVPVSQMDALQELGCTLSLCLSACNKLWVEDRSSRDMQERQKAALQVAKPGTCCTTAAQGSTANRC